MYDSESSFARWTKMRNLSCRLDCTHTAAFKDRQIENFHLAIQLVGLVSEAFSVWKVKKRNSYGNPAELLECPSRSSKFMILAIIL